MGSIALRKEAEFIKGLQFFNEGIMCTQTPHKHRDLIIAWANGAQIQFKDTNGNWSDLKMSPLWEEGCQYRIKQVPKPDKEVSYYAEYSCHVEKVGRGFANLKLTYDGETGKLKEAEVIS